MGLFSKKRDCSNYDKDIIPYLKSEIGSAYIRVDDSNFEIDDGSKPIFIDKQNR